MRLGIITVLLSVAACAPEDALVVDLVTDLRAGVEWDGVRVSVDGEAREERLADTVLDYSGGQRIFEGQVDAGLRLVEVALTNDGVELIRRPARVMVSGVTGVTIVISRECRGVACPGEDPTLEACLAGVCVAPSCTPETPESCPMAACTSDAECGAGLVGCATPRCVEGSCIAADDGSCGEGRYCNFDIGCAERPVGSIADQLRDRLVLWLPMDDDPSDGVITDATGNGFDAICASSVTCPTAVEGRIGGGLAFTTEQLARVLHTPTLDLTEGFTVAAWVWIDSTDSVVPLARPHGAATDDTWAFVRWDDTRSCFEHATATENEQTCGPSFPLGTWVHLAGTWNGTAKSYFINGARIGMNASPEPVVFDAHDLVLGRDENGGGPAYPMNGRLDDVRVYSRALSADEISQLAGLLRP